MRAIMVLLLGGGLLAGCQHPKSSDSGVTGVETTAKTRVEPASAKSPGARAASGQRTQSTPLHESAGKVASVNPGLRFVVVDFAFNPAPRVDQRMSVYRDGQKVGEIKISREARNNIIAADITAGEARVGDEVRTD